MSIRLSRSDITYMIGETYATDKADPFREFAYLMDYVEARVLDCLPRRINLSENELRDIAEKTLEIQALSYAYSLLTLETQTGLVRHSVNVIEQLLGERQAELIAQEIAGEDDSYA